MTETSDRPTPHIAIAGSVNLDLVILTDRLPTAGETIGNGTFETQPGGKGSNVAVAARRLSPNVALWACTGDDANADQALRIAQDIGVDLGCVARMDDQATGVAFINVSKDGENQIAVASGANLAFHAAHLNGLAADAVISQFEIPPETILAAFAAADRRAQFNCLNASPAGPPLAAFMDCADLIIVNEGEYEFYREELAEFKGLIAVTYGAKGAKLLRKGQLLAEASPPRVDVIDTTGAGDSFAAGLVVALMEGQEHDQALRFACAVGALTTTRLGAQVASPTRDEVEQLLASEQSA